MAWSSGVSPWREFWTRPVRDALISVVKVDPLTFSGIREHIPVPVIPTLSDSAMDEPQATLQGFARLNDDILRLIFVALYDDAALDSEESHESDGPPRTVEVLRLVCRDWCRIAETTPALWRYAVVNAFSSSRKTSVDSLATSLKRSGVLGFQLSLNLEMPFKSHTDPYFAMITPYTERLTALTVKCEVLHCLLARHPMEMLPHDLHVPLTGLAFTNLTHLHLENFFLHSFDFLLLFLVRSPALESLVIKKFVFPQNTPNPSTRSSPPIFLPSLRRMETDVNWICHVPSILRTPLLKAVTLLTHEPHKLERDEYSRFTFLRSVESVVLQGPHWLPSALVVLHGQAPRVREIRLHYCTTIIAFLSLLCSPQHWPTIFGANGLDFNAGMDHLNGDVSTVALQSLEYLEIVGGDVADRSVLEFVSRRTLSRGEGSKTVMVDISGCPGTTAQLRALTRQNRGTWAREPKVQDTSGFNHMINTCREHMGGISMITATGMSLINIDDVRED